MTLTIVKLLEIHIDGVNQVNENKLGLITNLRFITPSLLFAPDLIRLYFK